MKLIAYTLEEPLTKLSTPILVLRRLHILVIHHLNQLFMKWIFMLTQKQQKLVLYDAKFNDASFISLSPDWAENSSHKKCFSMFVTYCSLDMRGSYSILGYWGFQRKDFFWNNDAFIKNFPSRFISPFNICINFRSHCLAIYSSHLLKNPDIGELLPDYYILLLGLWKMFHYSPKKGAILENNQFINGKKKLKIIKAAVSRWLPHDRTQWKLNCLQKLLETIDHKC